MTRVNVYLPDDLAEQARGAGLNVSQVTQQALRTALAGADTDRWLDGIAALRPIGVSPRRVSEAVAAARDEFGSD
jgi:post-segregation antitoxin (ccd killing protein)